MAPDARSSDLQARDACVPVAVSRVPCRDAHSPSGGTMPQALLSSLLLPGTHPIRPNMAWNSYPQSSHTYSW